jgi:hypothetical protein
LSAIEKAKYRDDGAFFSPFRLKLVDINQFPAVFYAGRGNQHCTANDQF